MFRASLAILVFGFAVRSSIAVLPILPPDVAVVPARFPCTQTIREVKSANPLSCLDTLSWGTGLGGNFKSNHLAPSGSECVLKVDTGDYYCGWVGASCTLSTECDAGACVGGVCQGGVGQVCNGLDTNCLGLLYCTDSENAQTAADTCGGIGSFCQEPSLVTGNTAAEAQALFNNLCGTSYCNAGTGQCDVHVASGASCAVDPLYGCTDGYACTTHSDLTQTCQPSAGAAAVRARARRTEHLERRASLCPDALTACSVPRSTGFECVNTQTNLELCGGCVDGGGEDCTMIPNASGIQCSLGQCVVSSCDPDYTLDSSTNRCEKNE